MPPIPSIAPALNGIKQGTFVYKTIKDRWPSILVKVIDQVHRYRPTHIAVHQDGDGDIKAVIGELSEMKYHMATDKPLLSFNDDFGDASVWNDQLQTLRATRGESNVTWYKMDWLFVECYLYRRIAGTFKKTRTLTTFDPFAAQKQNAYVDGLQTMEKIAKYLLDIVSNGTVNVNEGDVLSKFIQICLWGNKCDLSLSGGENATVSSSFLDEFSQHHHKILVNQTEQVRDVLRSMESKRVDIILDNSGLELFSDMVLADYLISNRHADKVVFHGKTHPWFVSDVTNEDFNWTCEMLRGSHVEALNKIGHRWTEKVEQGVFEFRAHGFWTMPFAYSDMATYAPDLYKDLAISSLILFKGDLNYRKLVGDRDWSLDTPFKVALRGFCPAPFVALRTLKAETQAGLSTNTIDELKKKYGNSKEWMVTGDYAVVQYNA